ncbi:hypothetical protein KG088_19260 [Halomonas sp. TRM85114]|uniref:hypothetical protein n=1 Tax=Halomonas jincaotanensis TaxID=2810616 RepID=UPI001BD1FC0E|nr:hypothetical protein [Halomonas jincaotanensis]MBS9405716.1 hypothetical protein [Halomonas jincaotanensis]
MMDHDMKALEESLLTSRDEFISKHNREVDQAIEQFGKRNVKQTKIENPAAKESTPTRKRAPTESHKIGHLVRLGVRKKRLALDEIFEFKSSKISKLEARLDAEKAARNSGYPIIGYVHSIEKF